MYRVYTNIESLCYTCETSIMSCADYTQIKERLTGHFTAGEIQTETKHAGRCEPSVSRNPHRSETHASPTAGAVEVLVRTGAATTHYEAWSHLEVQHAHAQTPTLENHGHLGQDVHL